jgi:hypothetical protein
MGFVFQQPQVSQGVPCNCARATSGVKHQNNPPFLFEKRGFTKVSRAKTDESDLRESRKLIQLNALQPVLTSATNATMRDTFQC